jgi:hypothetical protein
MRHAFGRAAAFALCVSAYLPVAAQAVVPGSKVTITFEGLAKGREIKGIGEYDGLHWDASISAAAKGAFKTDQGFQAVIHKHVAAVVQSYAQPGFITPVSGLVSIRSGHFASFDGSPLGVTFKAYRNGILIGTMQIWPDASDRLVTFDRTFSNIDTFEIDGELSFDNVVVKFSQ